MTEIHQQPQSQPISQSLSEKLSRWCVLKAEIAAFQLKVDEEARLRREIFAAAFPANPEKGTHRLGIGYGKELKVVAKTGYTVDREAMQAALLHNNNVVNNQVLEQVIKFKPEVIESGLAAITDPVVKEALATFITSKPGMPGLEIVDAKR